MPSEPIAALDLTEPAAVNVNTTLPVLPSKPTTDLSRLPTYTTPAPLIAGVVKYTSDAT